MGSSFPGSMQGKGGALHKGLWCKCRTMQQQLTFGKESKVQVKLFFHLALMQDSSNLQNL